MAPKTLKGIERKAYMDAYAKGINKGNRALKVKKADVGAVKESKADLDFAAASQGSPGVGSATQYGKTRKVPTGDSTPMKGGVDQSAALALPGQAALGQEIKGGPPQAAGVTGGTGGIFPGLTKSRRGI